MRTCDVCGETKPLHKFSRRACYKQDKTEKYGNTCLVCEAEDDKKAIEQKVQRSKEMKAYEKKVIREQKQRTRQKVSNAQLTFAAIKSGKLLNSEDLKAARKEARTEAQKKRHDSLLIKLLGQRASHYGSKDSRDAELPKGLIIDPKEAIFLLENNRMNEKLLDIREKAFPEDKGFDWKDGLDEKALTKALKKEKPTGKSMIQRELAERELARRRLLPYIKRMKPNYEAGWVHHDICRRLERFVEDVAEGKNPRLMLFMPPRHGKSLIASDMFPSWVLGRHPEWEFIAASYAVSLPIEFSRNIRDRMKDEAYKKLFPKVSLRPDSQSSERWLTKEGGGYVAAGVGTGITGKGAHVFLIDDPIKDAQEADSETIRETAWNWWGSTAYTRLAPKSGVLIIQTRWHDDDLSGRLITKMKEQIKEGAPEDEIDKWEIIEYPAIATENEWLGQNGQILRQPHPDHHDDFALRKKGDALHEARFGLKKLKMIKGQLQPRHWSALYQQNPMPDEGEYFTKDMFRYTSSLPPLHHMKIFAAFDLAIGEKQQNDYTVGVVGGIDFADQLYVIDVLRFKGDSFKIVEAVLDVYEKYQPEMIGIERGQLELAIRPILQKRMRERKLYPTFADGKRALVPITDKLTRARPLQGRMQQGMVYFLDTQPWLETAQFELLRFPGGVHDDIVDALAWLMRMVTNETPPPKPGDKLLKKSWKTKINTYVNAGRGLSHMAS